MLDFNLIIMKNILRFRIGNIKQNALIRDGILYSNSKYIGNVSNKDKFILWLKLIVDNVFTNDFFDSMLILDKLFLDYSTIGNYNSSSIEYLDTIKQYLNGDLFKLKGFNYPIFKPIAPKNITPENKVALSYINEIAINLHYILTTQDYRTSPKVWNEYKVEIAILTFYSEYLTNQFKHYLVDTYDLEESNYYYWNILQKYKINNNSKILNLLMLGYIAKYNLMCKSDLIKEYDVYLKFVDYTIDSMNQSIKKQFEKENSVIKKQPVVIKDIDEDDEKFIKSIEQKPLVVRSIDEDEVVDLDKSEDDFTVTNLSARDTFDLFIGKYDPYRL